jgi:hypothetical protein
MQSGSGDAGTSATVVPLDTVRWARDVLCDLIALCPGWNITYQARTGLWVAQKQGGHWVLDASADPSALFITSADYVTLYIRLNLRAVTDLVAEFGDWQVACDSHTNVWSATQPVIAGEPEGVTFSGPSPLMLVHEIRAYMASIGEADNEPWLQLWGDPDGD